MKKIILIGLLVWSLPVFSQIKSATLTASGLTCSMCSKAIFKALEKVPSVGTLTVDIEKSTYAMTFKEGAAVELDDIKKAVEDAGFFVAELNVTAAFQGAAIANDAHVVMGGSTYHFLNVAKQVLNGDKTIKVVDKNYLPAKAHKKYSKYTKMKCYETGRVADCCPKDKVTSDRIYHVTL